ncbi:FAD-dependent oxidoreductase (plasmid) [Glaciihabitans sp. INWT7]|uniref:FAD-dependent oxidoreductase n=1 Tax=Glaciihabitans sp. INWT7 TaxID=2596912 RepID=UPI00162837D9|nr:FAD-dependent oxidoreductase [Glaciihabitans sp. INWT7]QNE48633.1 FAD-dependent oxidoreductase [Glaciihabitans sp. INWT7]
MTEHDFSAWSSTSGSRPASPPPVLADVDLVVVGAGAAGVAAATVAAEAGLSVILIERYGFAGGAAVAGMSGTICGMYLASDNGRGPEQVVYGFAERFRAALDHRGGLTPPQKYGKTWTSAHDPLMWRETADDLLITAGVRILFHTVVSGVVVTGATVTGVIIESNAGVSSVIARRVIDASGDAAVIARAGGGHRFGDHGRIQNPTMFFRLGNVDVPTFLAGYGPDTICPPEVTAKILAARATGANLPRQHIWIFTSTRPGELLVNATRLSARNGSMLNVIDPADFTEAEVAGRRQVREYAAFLAQELAGCGNSYVVDTGVEVGIRQTRSVIGALTLSNQDVVEARKRPTDGICRAPWPIELHDGDRPKLHWLIDDYYDVPYLSLVPERLENVIVAGRCLSAEHEALASARVTAQCFEYGHAAGRAAVMSIATGDAFRHLNQAALRAEMIAGGSAL